MPVAAFGTFHSDWAQEYMYQATVEAIRLGWRHLDTARAYENEALIGAAIKESIRLGYIASVRRSLHHWQALERSYEPQGCGAGIGGYAGGARY